MNNILSLQRLLEEIYDAPVAVHSMKVASAKDTEIVIEVELTVYDEERSKTFVTIIC